MKSIGTVATAALAVAVFSGCTSQAPSGAAVQPFVETSPSAVAASPAATSLPLSETVPKGSWSGDETVTKVSGAAKVWWDPPPKKGQVIKGTDPWEFTSTCTDTVCTGTITRAGDKEGKLPPRKFTWDGSSLTVTRDAKAGYQDCLYGKTPNGGKWHWKQTWTYRIDVDTDAQGKVTKILSTATVGFAGTSKPSQKCGSGLKPASEAVSSTLLPA